MDDANVLFSDNQTENDLRMTNAPQKVAGCFHSSYLAEPESELLQAIRMPQAKHYDIGGEAGTNVICSRLFSGSDDMKPRILVLYNDTVPPVHGSPDDAAACHENSEVARDVAQTLGAGGFETTPCTAEALFSRGHQELPPFNVVFNLCEGFRGDSHGEGAVAGWMEMMGWTFTGNSAWTLTICQDKAFTKMLLMQSNIPTPRFTVVPVGATHVAPLRSNTVIVKPLREDASQGITGRSVIRLDGEGTRTLREQTDHIRRTYRQPALIEEYIEGRELNVAILDGNVLPISEIDFSGLPAGRPHICTYDAKWRPGSTDYLLTPPRCPAQLDRMVEERVKEIALRAWHALRCRGYARIDIRLSGDGTPFVLEVNPNPSLHRDAGFSRAADLSGMSWLQMLEKIVRLPGTPC